MLQGLNVLERQPNLDKVLQVADLAAARRVPWLMMAILSPSASASSMECVVSRMQRPALLRFSSRQIARWLYGSMPALGSSKITCDTPHRAPSGQPLEAMCAKEIVQEDSQNMNWVHEFDNGCGDMLSYIRVPRRSGRQELDTSYPGVIHCGCETLRETARPWEQSVPLQRLTTRLPPKRAMATDSLRFIPPDRLAARASRLSARPTWAMHRRLVTTLLRYYEFNETVRSTTVSFQRPLRIPCGGHTKTYKQAP